MKNMRSTYKIATVGFWFLFFSSTISIHASENQADQAAVHLQQAVATYEFYQNYGMQLHSFKAENPVIFQFLRANLTLVDQTQWRNLLDRLTKCKTAQDRTKLRESMRQAVTETVKLEVVQDCVNTIDGIYRSDQWEQEVKKLPTDQDREEVVRIHQEFKEFVKPILQDRKA